MSVLVTLADLAHNTRRDRTPPPHVTLQDDHSPTYHLPPIQYITCNLILLSQNLITLRNIFLCFGNNLGTLVLWIKI